MPDLYRLLPLLALFAAAFMIASMRKIRTMLVDRQEKRALAEAAEIERVNGWIKKIRPAGAGPAISRDEHGQVVLFRGLRRYGRSTRRTRRSRKA